MMKLLLFPFKLLKWVLMIIFFPITIVVWLLKIVLKNADVKELVKQAAAQGIASAGSGGESVGQKLRVKHVSWR